MSGSDMFYNARGWRVWKYRFFTAGCFVAAGCISIVLKQYIGTPVSHAQSRGPSTAQAAPQNPRGTAQPTQANAQQQPAASQQTISVLAIVNGEQITRQQLADECLKRFGNDILERLTNRQLILSQCERQGIVITPQEIDEEIRNVALKFGIPPDRYLNMLETRRKISPDQYRREIIWPTLALRRLARDHIQVSPEEIRTQLETEIGPRVQVRLIALPDAETAEKVLQLARKSPDDFGTLAKDYSVDPASASTRGMVPPIRLHIGEPTIEKVAFSLQPGQVSDVVEIADQFIILKCERQFPSQEDELNPEQRREFEKRIAAQLSENKLAQVSQQMFKELQSQAKIVNVFNDAQLRQQYPGVAAQIDGTQISVRELAEECIARHGADVLEGEINRLLLMQQLKRAKLAVEQADIDAEVSRAADSFGMLKPDGSPDVEQWLAYITDSEKVTVDLYVRDVVWPTVALKNLVADSVSVTEEDLQKAFEANFGERVEALAIVLPNQKQAQEVWNLANQNQTDEYFGNLANAYSVEPGSKANFGVVPPIQKHGGRPALEEEAFRLKPGELGGIVNIGENWVILRCVGRTEPRVQPEDFDKVRNELQKDIHEKKLRMAMSERFEQVRQASQIDNYLSGTTQLGSQAATARSAQAVQNRLPFAAQK